MCRIAQVLVVAPKERHLELRRTLGSLEYDIVATRTPDEPLDVTADIALVADPDAGAVAKLRALGVRIAGFGERDPGGLDLWLAGDVASFKTRIWDALKPPPGG